MTRAFATCNAATSRARDTPPRATRKASGKVGVALATSGPGATNLVTWIADAVMDSVPTVFLPGQVRTDLIGTDGFQEADIPPASRCRSSSTRS